MLKTYQRYYQSNHLALKSILFTICFISLFLPMSQLCAGVSPKDDKRLNGWRGFYIGLQVGYSFIQYDNYVANGFTINKMKSSGLAPNIQVGYSFNRYIASELGIVYASKAKLNQLDNQSAIGKFKQNALYLVAKPSLPITHAFSLFAKAGFGYVVRDQLSFMGDLVLPSGEFVIPIYGVGADYRIAQNWILEVSWLQAAARKSKSLPATNYVGVGASYLFPW